MTHPNHRKVRLAAASAALAARASGGPIPANPYYPSDKRAFYWQSGTEMAGRMADQILGAAAA